MSEINNLLFVQRHSKITLYLQKWFIRAQGMNKISNALHNCNISNAEDLWLFKSTWFNLVHYMNIHSSRETKKIIGANPLTAVVFMEQFDYRSSTWINNGLSIYYSRRT